MEGPGMFMDTDTAGAAGAPAIEPAGICGNGIIEVMEQCDGVNLNGATCGTLGEGTGTLGCDASCMYDLSMCSGPTS
jgi:hypothetical protein